MPRFQTLVWDAVVALAVVIGYDQYKARKHG